MLSRAEGMQPVLLWNLFCFGFFFVGEDSAIFGYFIFDKLSSTHFGSRAEGTQPVLLNFFYKFLDLFFGVKIQRWVYFFCVKRKKMDFFGDEDSAIWGILYLILNLAN